MRPVPTRLLDATASLGVRSACVALTVIAATASAQVAPLPADPAPRRSLAAPIVAPSARTLDDQNRIRGCVVGLVNKIDLPAPEAGLLTDMTVEEGDPIDAEQVIAKIDAREAEQALRIAQYALRSAVQVARDDVQIRYAEAQKEVEKADWDSALKANQEVRNAVSAEEVRHSELEYRAAALGVEKALKDQQLASLEADTKRAEMAAAELAIERRLVRAPWGGEVLRVEREQGEWVQPGETIAEIAQLETLQVGGYVRYDQFSPAEVFDRKVTVEVLVGDRIVTAPGRIVYVSPIATYDKWPKFEVRAEITNRRENGRWLISPNLQAAMTIHLGSQAVGARTDGRPAAR